ncbi:MAG TPA: thrombospondin [Nannocystis sp.]|jgi:hypothetical protein
MPRAPGNHSTDLGPPRPRLFLKNSPWRLAAALAVLATPGMSACVSDPDCGICDPDNLILQSIAGVNYAGKTVKLLGPECVGDACPGPMQEGQYFVEKIIPCIETADALDSPRGVDEWCKVSPMVVDSGLQFIFNNLLDPTSVELVRKKADNPQLFEVFDWKTQIVHLEGPITRFNGDYRPGATPAAPDTVERAQSLACIDNLRRLGRPYDHTVLASDPGICDGTHVGPDGRVWPLRTQLQREDAGGRTAPTTVETWRGETDTRAATQSCTRPQDGVDTCCDVCDYELAVNVSKYGVLAPVDELAPAGDRRRRFADAITCDPGGDKLRECRDFTPHVDRSHEVRSYEYTWDGARQRFRVPRPDKIRETHPDDRPADAEQRTVPCQTDEDCTGSSQADLPGMECVGHLADDPGTGCRVGDDCVERRCVAEWFVDCRPDKDTTGAQGYCVDRRWSGEGVAACFTNGAPYYVCEDTETCAAEDRTDPGRRQSEGARMSLADADRDGRVEAIEGCRASLGGPDGGPCDPLDQPGVLPIVRHDRLDNLPTPTRTCICEDEPAEGCADFVASLCHEDGDPKKPIAAEKRGQYAVKFVTRFGGVIYDPALKGVQFLPADLGGIPRSLVETCSRTRSKGAGPLNLKDGWRANDAGPELFEDADRAMCSSSEYRVVFNHEPAPGQSPLEYIRDKVGNTLRGKSTYVLHTPDFHVVPGSGFPTDNLRIGACDDFELRFSNKYDLDPRNLRKLQLVEISADGAQQLALVAGGPDCSDDPDAAVPCLTIDVRDQDIGSLRVRIDAQRFGADHLVPGHRYRLAVPGLELAPGETVFDVIAAGGERYLAAFQDACGMPLVTSMPRLDAAGKLDPDGRPRDPDSHYDFAIDPPKPKEDREQDGVQFSCDNAPDNYNPDQEDMDQDGWGDIIDLCATIPEANNSADTDKDGVGNSCDRCPRALTAYNRQFDETTAKLYMRVRNIPHQQDADQDGVGDACDNCVVRANCGDFGPEAEGLRPAHIGAPVPHDKDGVCQSDVDGFAFVGDACVVDGEPLQLPGAAARVGVADDEDFDQDGIANLSDRCPRQPVTRIECTLPEDCPANAECTGGLCNHVDTDNDAHGDICDTCPSAQNPGQTLDGAMQQDDPDADFVGSKCETNTACDARPDPRPIAFYSETSAGQCCVQLFSELAGRLDPGLARRDLDAQTCELVDPAVPILLDCPKDQEEITCRVLPQRARERPGVVDLPPGCDGPGEPYTLDHPDIHGDVDLLYQHMCLMPQPDQDFDGIGDACDLCPFAFDPENAKYKDANGKLWPTSGKYCAGEYDPENVLTSCEEAVDSDGEGSSGDSTG